VRSADFEEVAREPRPDLDRLALALAGEFRPVERQVALAELDRLGVELARSAGGPPAEEAAALRELLGARECFTGNREDYDDPANSMLDLVLERRTGLPILLSVVYVEVARRAGVELAGVGLEGHFVVGHFGVSPPLLLDPFSGGRSVDAGVREHQVRAWGAHETALRMLNNLVRSYAGRGALGRAIRAAELRLVLPLDTSARSVLETELRGLRARLN
jgi:regulator of sirC expression with transglutaminase-like and TPR domain